MKTLSNLNKLSPSNGLEENEKLAFSFVQDQESLHKLEEEVKLVNDWFKRMETAEEHFEQLKEGRESSKRKGILDQPMVSQLREALENYLTAKLSAHFMYADLLANALMVMQDSEGVRMSEEALSRCDKIRASTQQIKSEINSSRDKEFSPPLSGMYAS